MRSMKNQCILPILGAVFHQPCPSIDESNPRARLIYTSCFTKASCWSGLAAKHPAQVPFSLSPAAISTYKVGIKHDTGKHLTWEVCTERITMLGKPDCFPRSS